MALALGHPVDVGLQAMPRYDAGGRLKEKWLPNGVNSRYAYFTDNTLAQVVNRSLTASIISQHDYVYDAYANRCQADGIGFVAQDEAQKLAELRRVGLHQLLRLSFFSSGVTKPMGRLGGSGGVISSRIASKTCLN